MHELNTEVEQKEETKIKPIDRIKIRCICGHHFAHRLCDPMNIKFAHWYCENCGKKVRR